MIITVGVYKYIFVGLMLLLWYLLPLSAIVQLNMWRSVLFAEETDVPGENNRPVANHCQTQSHNAVSSIPRHLLAIVEVICTDCMHR